MSRHDPWWSEWFPRLRDASDKQRKNWRFIGKGMGVHWPEIGEDIAVSTVIGR
jgi:hypothetical protein